MTLINEIIEVDCTSRNKRQYELLGYNAIVGQKILVKVKDLPSSSRLLIKLKCDYCGEIFERKNIDRNRHISNVNKDSCIKCRGRKLVENNQIVYGVNSTSQLSEVRKMQANTYKEKHGWTWDKINNYIKESGYKLCSPEQEVDAYTKLMLLCPEKHKFPMDIHHFCNHGNRCPYCAGNKQKTTATFKDEVFAIYGDEYEVVGEYKQAHTKIKMRHNYCGHEYSTPHTSIIFEKRTQCPKCSTGTSKLEKSTMNYLSKANIHYDKEKTFNDLVYIKRKMRYDFFIDNKILIEIDGQQHFHSVDFANYGSEWANKELKKIKKKDKIKNQYCIENNIPLLRIPYWEYKDIKQILESALMHYNIIPKTESYNYNLIAKWVVNSEWDHEEYIAMCPKNRKTSIIKRRVSTYEGIC